MEIGLATFADLGEISPQERMRNLIEEAVLADQVGLDVFAVGEHHRRDYVVAAPAVALAGDREPDRANPPLERGDRAQLG